MVFHRRIGMRDRDFIEGRIAALACSPEEQLQVHHIVDDDRILPREVRTPVIPRANATGGGIEARSERAGAFEQHLFVAVVRRETLPVAVTAVHHKADIVRTPVRLLAFEGSGIGFGLLFPEIVAGVFVHVPQFSGEKAAAPVCRVYQPHRTVGFDVARRGEFGERFALCGADTVGRLQCNAQLRAGKIEIRLDGALFRGTGVESGGYTKGEGGQARINNSFHRSMFL